MRFLLLSQYYPPEAGAASVRLQAMVRELTRRGHEVDVVTALPNYPQGRIYDAYRSRAIVTETRDGARVTRVWLHAATGSGIGRALMFATFTTTSTLATLWRRRADVVLVESPPLSVAVGALVRRWLRRTPYVLLVADLWPDTAVELGLISGKGRLFQVLSRLERLAYRCAWKISPVTEGQVETLVRDKGVERDRIAFLPNGVDTHLFTPLAGDDRSADRGRVVLFAGTLGYAHGLDIVLDAAPLVQQRHPDALFLLVGGGSDRERLQARVRDESIAGVEFRDPVSVDDVAPYFRDCAIGVSTIRDLELLADARPAKVFPVMASGRPIVYAGHGEGAALVRQADAGIVVAPEDHRAFAEAIVELLDDPAEAERLGRNGRRFVEENFSWAELLDRWLAEIER